jgi:hypothetical protein
MAQHRAGAAPDALALRSRVSDGHAAEPRWDGDHVRAAAEAAVKLALPLAEPQCGTCNACCVAYTIDEMEKPAGERCEQLVGGEHGCRIYDERPRSCREYRCAFIAGQVKVRPDVLGVVVRETQRLGSIRVIHIEEMVPGALESWAWKRERARLIGAPGEYVMWSRSGAISSNAFGITWQVIGETLYAIG